MARFSNCRLIPNFIFWTLNTLLYTTTIQNKDAAMVVKLEMEVGNAKS
jgi:hypothetical protein